MIQVIYERNGIRYDWLRGRNKTFIMDMLKSLGKIKVIKIEWE